MSDFTSEFWNWYIAVLTVVSIIGCAVLLWMQTTRRAPGAKIDTTGHVWDEDLQEWNNPLPNWWRWLFYITVVFSLVYLAFYPGLGSFRGSLGWSQAKQYDDEVKKADATYGPIYAKYAAMDIEKVAADKEAMNIGQNLYLNYCAQCHASDARGARGFPNLADGDWLWGGAPNVIEETILNGRTAVMPPQGATLGPDVKDVALRHVAVRHDERLDPRGPGQGEVRADLRGLPWSGREGQPGARRAEPYRQDLALRGRRGRHYRYDPERPDGPDARLEGLPR
jgi:cytochrome c oxidase cbb3-type subunit 3